MFCLSSSNSNMNLDLGFLEIKDKKNVSNPLNLLIKILIEKSHTS